jgi:hypothetical protein
MLYISDIIKENVDAGAKPVLIPGKKLVMLFECPYCKAKKKMVKFSKGRGKKQVCSKCHRVHHTATWKHAA